MCGPRSAVPDVATAQSLAPTTRASRPGLSGSAMPIRHGSRPPSPPCLPPPCLPPLCLPPPCLPSPCPRPPAHCTSPPPLTTWSAEPASASSAAARSTAQPFTYPDGSNWPPGATVKYPPDRSRTTAQAARTSAISGAHASTVTSARASSDTSLSARYGENTRSTQCSHRIAASSDPSWQAEPGTSNDTTVPITCSACLTRTSTADVALGTVVQGALQGLNVAAAGVGGAGDGVDPRALRAQRLADQLRERELADLQVVLGRLRLLKDVHLDDLAGGDHDLDLDRAVGRVSDVPRDRALPRWQGGGGLGRRDRTF